MAAVKRYGPELQRDGRCLMFVDFVTGSSTCFAGCRVSHGTPATRSASAAEPRSSASGFRRTATRRRARRGRAPVWRPCTAVRETVDERCPAERSRRSCLTRSPTARSASTAALWSAGLPRRPPRRTGPAASQPPLPVVSSQPDYSCARWYPEPRRRQLLPPSDNQRRRAPAKTASELVTASVSGVVGGFIGWVTD